MNGKADEALKSSWNYSNRVVSDFDAYFNLAEGIGEDVYKRQLQGHHPEPFREI